jgi:hypothetical protein
MSDLDPKLFRYSLETDIHEVVDFVKRDPESALLAFEKWGGDLLGICYQAIYEGHPEHGIYNEKIRKSILDNEPFSRVELSGEHSSGEQNHFYRRLGLGRPSGKRKEFIPSSDPHFENIVRLIEDNR